MDCLLVRHITTQHNAGFLSILLLRISQSTLVQALQSEDFLSVCMNSSTETAVIEEETVHTHFLENNLLVTTNSL